MSITEQPSAEACNTNVLAAAVYHHLAKAYGSPDWRPANPPVDELVLTILSQNTNDTNAGRAFHRLKARFSDWHAVMDASVEEVIETIRCGGLAQHKAPRIQAALRRIYAERGEIDLTFLSGLRPAEAMAWLTSLHGVGHKTASIVLLFCFGMPAFPVDTHVGRVTRRLGLAGPGDSEEKIKALWEKLVPEAWFYSLHLNLIRHGRTVCQARNPACERCSLLELCVTGIKSRKNKAPDETPILEIHGS